LPAHHPDHWELLQGPANWFQLWHPPAWKVSERSGAITLALPGDAFLAIHSFAAESPAGGTRTPHLDNIVRLFPRARGVRHLTFDSLEHLVDCVEGEADLRVAPRWWQKFFIRTDWRRWQMWEFRRGAVTIVVTFVHGPVFDPELATMVRMVLGTLELPEVAADSPPVFARRVLDLARRKFPLLESSLQEDFQVRIGESSINLFNVYRSYLRAPARFEELILPALATVVQVQEWGDEQAEPPFDAVCERIMPMLYSEDAWRTRFPGIVGTPWIAGLAILYVIDESQAYWYIRQQLLDKWGMTVEQVHDRAIQNLAQYFENQPMEMAVAGSEQEGPTMLMPGKADSYNSARLLSEPFTARLREVIGGNFAVGMPGRDFFVVVNLKHPRMLDHVRRKVREDYAQMDHPLTDRMLLVSVDGVSELVNEPIASTDEED
jgi:hypothetical protein